MRNAFSVVADFEAALCEYTGAPHAVAVNSCTMAILLALDWYRQAQANTCTLRIPRHTYVGVPMAAAQLGFKIQWHDREWQKVGYYTLGPSPVVDAARLFTSGMFSRALPHTLMCVSFHWTKTLGIQQGGAILLDSADIAAWLRRARFDGRTEGVPVKEDRIDQMGWHCYMSPEVAAAGLVRLMHLPKDNPPLPEANYPDCSLMPVFKKWTVL